MIKRIFNKNFIVLLDQAVFSGGSFVTTIILARFLLSTLDFGLFSSLLLFNYAVVSVLNALIIQPLQVSISKQVDQKSYVSFSFITQVLLIVILALSLQLLNALKIDFLSSFRGFEGVIILYIIGFLMNDYFRKLFLAKSEVVNAFLVDFLTIGSQLILLFVLWYNSESEFSTIVFYLGFSYLPGLIYSLFVVGYKTPDLDLFKEYVLLHFHQGKWLLLTSITQWWSSNLFVVFSGLFLGVEMLGAFRLVQSLFGVLNLILQTFENFVLPEAARKLVESKEIAKKYLLRISLKSSVIFGIMLAVLFFFSSTVIQLVGGEKYVPYSFIVKGMVLLYVFIFLGYPIRIAIRILVLNKVFFTGYLLSFLFSLFTFYFLLSEFGMNGAIVGLISAQIITLGYWQFVLKKHNFILWK